MSNKLADKLLSKIYSQVVEEGDCLVGPRPNWLMRVATLQRDVSVRSILCHLDDDFDYQFGDNKRIVNTCGNRCCVNPNHLEINGVKKTEIVVGQKFGRLTILSKIVSMRKNEGIWVRCRCECGTVVDKPFQRLKVGNTRSCGCLFRDQYFYES